MESINKTGFFNELKDFLSSDGIELVKYSDGRSFNASDYYDLFRIIIHTMIGVCVEKQCVIDIDGLCKVGFNVETQDFTIDIDKSIQDKLENNKSMICNDMLLPVTKEDVIFMLNNSKISEVL